MAGHLDDVRTVVFKLEFLGMGGEFAFTSFSFFKKYTYIFVFGCIETSLLHACFL